MKYLLDSDTLIRAKNDFYPFSDCPGFWEWLEKLNQDEVVFSIDVVKSELVDEGDQLSIWAKSMGSKFFLPSHGPGLESAISAVVNWAADSQFSKSAQQKFLSGADFMLVAHGMVKRYAVVSFEVSAPNSISSIKLPDACARFGVACINLYQLRNAVRATHPLRLVRG